MISGKSISRFSRTAVIALGLMLPVLLPACSAFNETGRECPDPDADSRSTVAIEFRVHTTAEQLGSRSAGSRADANGHDEELSDNAQIEDYICPSDFGVFIFAGKSGDSDPMLLYYNTSVTESQAGFAMTGSIGDYTISLTLPATLVEQVLGNNGTFSPLSPTGDRSMKLTVAMLANIGGSSQNHSDYTEFDGLKAALGAEDYTTVSKLSDFTTIAEGLTYAASTSATQIHIPMYGISTFTLSESDMYYSRPDSRIELGDISMLRAMMKMRVVDNIENKTADGYPKVTSATLYYQAVNGYVTPAAPGSYVNGMQVHTDRVIAPQDGVAKNTLPLRAGTVVDNSFVGCAPPQTITSYAPSMAIYVQRDAASTPQRFDVDITPERLPGIADPDKWGAMMLRNHVYTLSVVKVDFGAELTLTATVADWDDSAFEFDFSNDVSSIPETGKIEWKADSYKEIVDETTLVMNPWHDSAPVPAVCTFGLATPVGALWTATLIVDEGATDAFRFVDENGPFTDDEGNELSPTTIEGRIDGKLATLRIATTSETPAQNNRVSLQIVVVTQGGAAYTIATDGNILLKWSLLQNLQQ